MVRLSVWVFDASSVESVAVGVVREAAAAAAAGTVSNGAIDPFLVAFLPTPAPDDDDECCCAWFDCKISFARPGGGFAANISFVASESTADEDVLAIAALVMQYSNRPQLNMYRYTVCTR